MLCHLLLGCLCKEGMGTAQSLTKQTQMLTFKNKDFLSGFFTNLSENAKKI